MWPQKGKLEMRFLSKFLDITHQQTDQIVNYVLSFSESLYKAILTTL